MEMKVVIFLSDQDPYKTGDILRTYVYLANVMLVDGYVRELTAEELAAWEAIHAPAPDPAP